MTATDSPYTISIVEDEEVLRNELAFQLEYHGFKVEAFESASQLYRALALQPLTIVVLDIGLPGEDGLSICRHLRSKDKSLGIVFITARGQREDRLKGLESGTDAYLTKPVDIEELILILKRLASRFIRLKRASDIKSLAANDSWHIDPNSLCLISPGGIQIKLSINESRLLNALFNKEGNYCTHAELGMALGIHPNELDKHRIEVIISRLSNKVLTTSGLSLPIRSFRNIGYGLQQ